MTPLAPCAEGQAQHVENFLIFLESSFVDERDTGGRGDDVSQPLLVGEEPMNLHFLLVRLGANAPSQPALAAIAIALHSGQRFGGRYPVENAEQQRRNGAGASISVVAVDVETIPCAQRGEMIVLTYLVSSVGSSVTAPSVGVMGK